MRRPEQPSATRRRSGAVRAFALVAGLGLVGAACSTGSGSDSADDPTTVTATPNPSVSAGVAPAGSDVPGAVEPDAGVEEWSVAVEVSVRGDDGGFGGSLSWTFDPRGDGDADPFDRLASCSGWRDRVGAYSVLVQSAGPTRLFSLSVADAVDGAGVYDALVRIERRDDDTVVAAGTVTLDDGLQAGEFVAFDADGAQVEGTFACDGADPPEPLVVGDPDDDRLDSIEVTALLRRDGRELIVGLATDAVDGASCAGGDGVAVSVDGDESLGAITRFDLSAGDSPTLAFVVGGRTFAFTDVEVTTAGADLAGSFSAELDGVVVDGAFRCT